MGNDKEEKSMYYLKRFLVLLVALIFLWPSGVPVFADAGDEATLGMHDSDGAYRWRVDGDGPGHLLPGADGTYNIGDSTHEVNNIYAEDIDVSETIQFQSTLYASGHNSGATTVGSAVSPLTSANLAFALVRIADGSYGDRALPDGTTGKIVTIQFIGASPSYVISGVDSAMTMTGWASITFDDQYDRITLLWADDTTGWIIMNNDGCTIGY